jgi:hypothetical protein
MLIWFSTNKNQESHWVPYMPHIVRKFLMKGYNFVLDLISVRGLHQKLWASKMWKVLILRIVNPRKNTI